MRQTLAMATSMMSARLGATVAPSTVRRTTSQRAAAAVPTAAPLAASKSAVLAGAQSNVTLRASAGRRSSVAARAGVRTPVAQAASSESKILGVSMTTLKKARPRLHHHARHGAARVSGSTKSAFRLGPGLFPVATLGPACAGFCRPAEARPQVPKPLGVRR